MNIDFASLIIGGAAVFLAERIYSDYCRIRRENEALQARVAKLEQAKALRLPWEALDVAMDAIALLDTEEDDREIELLKAQQRKHRTATAKQKLITWMQTGTKGVQK